MGQAIYNSGTDRSIGQGTYNLYYNPAGDSLNATVTNVSYKFYLAYNGGQKVDLGDVDIYLYSPDGERHTIYYNFDHFGYDTDAGKDSDSASDYDIYYDGVGGESTFSTGFDGDPVNGNWRLRIDNDTGKTLTMNYFESKVDFLSAPDMIVENIAISGDKALGEKVKIEATLKNIGETDYLGIGKNFDVEYLVNGKVIGTDSVTYGLNSGQSNKESITYTVETAGQQNVEVRVSGISGEASTSNNSRSTGFYAEAPDLVVQDIKVFGEIKAGNEIKLEAVLANIGGADYGGLIKGGFDLEYYVEKTDGTDRYIGKDEVSFGLTADQTNSETIKYTLKSTDTGKFKVKIVDTQDESNTFNNARTELVGVEHDGAHTVADSLEHVQIGTLFARSVYGEENINALYNGTADNGLTDRYDSYFDDFDWKVMKQADLGSHFVENEDARFKIGGLFEGKADALIPSWDAQSILALGETSDGAKTLVLSFRGTDSEDSKANAFINGQAFSGDGLYHHYNAHKPLVEAALAYANNPSNDIDKMIVSGHSLGGSMADIFASIDAQRLDDNIDLTVVSLASAGVDKTLYSHTQTFDGFETQHDYEVVDVDGSKVELTAADHYIGISHNMDAVTFAERVDLDSLDDILGGLDGFVGNNVLRKNINFDDAITQLYLPNVNNEEQDSGGSLFPMGFGAHHNVGLYWANLGNLVSDPLAEHYDNSQKITFGLTDYAKVKDIDGTELPLFQTYTRLGDIGYDNDVGRDALAGNNGDDYILGLSGNDDMAGGRGNDLLSGGLGNDAIAGDDGDDKLDGGKGKDDLSGGDGHDAISGGHGKDNVSGGQGNDTLGGGRGKDVLSGGKGDDTLNGGIGHDKLTGGDGADTFMLKPNTGTDRITDFDPSSDEIWIDASLAAGRDAAALATLAEARGSGVSIDFGADALILKNIDLARIDEIEAAIQIV